MEKFIIDKLESLRKTGLTMDNIRQNVSDAINHSERCSADVRTLNTKNGQYEIVLTGTLKKESWPKEQ